MSKVPSSITEDAVLDTYLRFQVSIIDQILSSAKFHYGEPFMGYQQPFRPLIGNALSRQAIGMSCISTS